MLPTINNKIEKNQSRFDKYPSIVKEIDVGIKIQSNLLSNAKFITNTVNKSSKNKLIIGKLPKNYLEVEENKERLQSRKTGGEERDKPYSKKELIQICRNLYLPTDGKKIDLVRRINNGLKHFNGELI